MIEKIERTNVEGIFELSMVQKGMLYHYLKEDDQGLYNVQLSFDIRGQLELSLLQQAFDEVQAANQVLRSVFRWSEVSKPVQIILHSHHLPIAFVDFSQQKESRAQASAGQFLQEDLHKRLDLARQPLRLTVLRVAEQQFVLVITHHHILYDGWSTAILLKELFRYYNDLAGGRHIVHVEKPAYGDVYRALAQRVLQGAGDTYWKNHLSGYPVTACFPKTPVGDVVANRLQKRSFHIAGLDVKAFSALYGVTGAAIIYAAYGVLLRHWFHAEDIVFGTAVSTRDETIRGLEMVMGNFINTVPLRMAPAADETFAQLTIRVNKALLERSDYCNTSYAEIKKLLDMKPSEDLFDTVIAVENYPVTGATTAHAGWDVRLRAVYEHTGIPLVVTVFFNEALELECTYDAELVNEAFIGYLETYFGRVLRQGLHHPGQAVCFSDLISAAERKYLTQELNDTAVSYPQRDTIISLFEQQVKRTPGNTALRCGNLSLTYMELQSAIHKTAAFLKSNAGINAGDLVGVMLPREIQLLPVIFGILKAGAVYVPIDPDFPAERVNAVAGDAGLKAMITRAEHVKAPLPAAIALIDPDEAAAWSDDSPVDFPAVDGNDLAYVIYTSGSTGKPKGVMVEHRSVVNRITWMQQQYPLTEDDVLLQKTPLVFDVSIWELYWWSFTGASLCLPEPGAEKDPAEIIRAIQEHGVTTIHFVPSMLNAFLATMNDGFNFAAIKRLRQVFTSGEALMPAQVQLFADTLHKYCGSRLINLYGPTEATVDVSFYECSFEHEYHVVPIGKPINNVRLYILGKDQSLLPAGAVGELCIAGVGLARGYLGREALTAEKFTQCPALPGERIYRTGDLARWLPNGNIAFLGRQDEQVKIRGVRIEPGEVASHLLAHTHITEAAVVARERNGEKYLVAYYVSDSPLERKDLRDWLSRSLPEYMVPAWYVHLRAMPLTVSGKLDRNMLPEPTALTDFSEEGDAPANETEQKLAQLWQEVLGHAYVNTNSSFFDTGGDSLQALRLINRIGKQFDVELPLKTLFDNPTIKSLATCLRARTGQHAGKRGRLFKTEKRQYYPLSSVQKRLYFLYQFDKSSLAYNAPLALRITGPVDKSRMTEALQELVRRNENLRTLFVTVNGEPYQKILDSVTVMMEEYRSDGNTGALLQQFIRPFDVGIAPLMRAGWIECEEEEHILLLDLHHIITDGVSQGLLVRELMALYQGTSVAAPVFQYRDYAAWQNSAGYQAVVSGSREFWINEFAEEPPVLGLPLDFKRPLIRSYEGANVHFSLSSRETAMLKALGDAEGATMFMVVLSLFSILLGKLAAEEDVVIGTPASGRDHADLEAVMGMFVNTVVIRTRPQGEIPFRSFLREIRSRTLAVFDRQAYPYELLIDDLKVSRDTSRNPLFDVWFVYQNFETAVPEVPGLTITPCEIGAPISQFDISLTAGEREGRLHLNFEYSTELFSAETIDRFIGYFRAIVTAITGNAGCRLRDIGLVGPAERRLLLHTFNETETPFERQKTFFTLFQEQAQGTPEYPAVVYNGAQLTYSALLKRATDLSAYLAAKGIGRGSRVALYMSRGIDMLTAILGTFGAGAAYVPVEMEYPPHRVMEILADSEPGIVLVDDQTLSAAEAIKSKVPAIGEIRSVSHMEQWSADEDAVPEVAGPDDIAYIIYTSGTTGKPKGAMVHQQGMLNHLYAMIEAMGPGNGDVIAQTASCSFDISVWQFLCALLVGGQTCIIDKDTQLDAGSLLREMQESKVTIAEMVPSLLRAFVDEAMNNAGKNHLPCLRWMIPTAEQISTALVNKWYDCYPGVPLINAYGPAEASDDVTLYFIGKDVAEGEIIPIGKPVRNTRIYITDQYMNLCPLGVRGEICIAGISVGKGYWKDQEKTLRAFVPNPFSGDGEEDYRYLYRTGDTGYYRPDGNIVFTGRRDDQVKVRGHRIECREIESHLLQWPGIREVTVLPREKNGAQYLVAYYIADTALEDAVLRGFLSGRLPDYMVPSFYVWLKRMPLTVNGKLDKKALPAPEHKQAPVDNGQVLTVEEKLLVETWSKVLAADGISVTDNFFAVGGDSIRSTQIVSALRSAGYELSVKDIFIHQTIRELAVRLKRTGKQADQSAVVGRAALTPIQRLFFETPFARRHHYNQSVMLLFPDGLGADRARQMLAMLQEHHDALRMVFAEEAEGVFMHNQGPELAVSLEEYDLRGEPEAEASLLARCDEIQAGIDLAAGPLLRGGLFHLAEGSRLLLVVHHLVVDGVSWRILLEDMHTLYGQQQRNEPLQLPGKTDAFLLWPSRLSEYSAGKAFAKGRRYWNTFDAGAYPVLNRDYPEGTNKTGGQQVERFRLSRQLTGRLLGEAHRSFGTRINDLLLAGLLLGMHRCYQQPGILLDLESHGREELPGADISRTVGWFTSIYPVWLSGDVNNLTRLVREVKETLRRVPNNGIDYMIRQYVCNSVEHTHRRSRVIFNYLGQFDTAESGEYFTAVSGAGGREIWEGETAEYDWEVSGMVLGGELEMTLTYSPRQYAAERVRIFMQSYRDALEEITEACCRHGKVELSPSDLVYKSLTLSQVDALQSEHALENIYPLSPMQEGMLFHALYDREGDQYFEQLSCRLQGRLDIAAVEHAMNGIIARYAILRTQFVHEGYERPLQIVYGGRRMKVSYEDMREACVQEGTVAVVDRIRQQDRSRKFDLGRDVLMRVTVLRLAASAYELIWSYHHVLMDGWCMGIIMRDFKALYQQYSRGSEVLLPAVRPYGDYISWLEERDAALSAQYWKEYLSGFENLT
ncbi:amino acid adenylation domain-containing protein, partial [Chitinophaga sp. 22536]|uniref:amino acid adenylation domain-containing protein n=1 Tax=Chitinophaga sp. 22536 TaxID=3453939 RepID=UPI003F877521